MRELCGNRRVSAPDSGFRVEAPDFSPGSTAVYAVRKRARPRMGFSPGNSPPTPRIRRSQHILGPHANEKVIRQVPPQNLPVRIQKKFSRARNVRAVRAGVRMHQIPLPDRLQLIVRQEQKRIVRLLAKTLRNVRRVHADRHHTDSARVELRQLPLEAP